MRGHDDIRAWHSVHREILRTHLSELAESLSWTVLSIPPDSTAEAAAAKAFDAIAADPRFPA